VDWGRVRGEVDHVPGSVCVVDGMEMMMYLVKRISGKETMGLW